MLTGWWLFLDSMKRLLKEAGVKEDRISVIYNAIDEADAAPSTSAESVKDCYGIKIMPIR